MSNSINLNLNNIGPISSASLDISKINVIGGKNSTGKSTSSKLLYCFLSAFSSRSLDNSIDRISNLSVDLINVIESHLDSTNNDSFNKHLVMLRDKFSNVDDFNSLMILINFLERFIKLYFKNSVPKTIDNKLNDVKKTVSLLKSNNPSLNRLYLIKILKSELDIRMANTRSGFMEFKGNYDGNPFNFLFDFERYDFNNKDGSFYVNDVHYLDSFSIYDSDDNGLYTTDHVKKLSKDLKDFSEVNNIFDDIINEKIINLEKKIANLIGGTVKYDGSNMIFTSEDKDFAMKNTASGVKQIAIIQALLANRKLKPGDFLIIDEPEVNLHPEWQLKFAEILVLLAKDLDVTVYINSHSPMFIEAIDTFAEFNDLEDETNFYLTESAEDNKYNLIKIDSDELYIIYDNLGDPYDVLDSVRLSKGRM